MIGGSVTPTLTPAQILAHLNTLATVAITVPTSVGDALTVSGGTTNGGVYIATTGPLTTTIASIGSTSAAPSWITGTGNTVLRINATTSTGATATNRGVNVKPTLVAGSYTCGLVSKINVDLTTVGAGAAVTRTQGVTVRADTSGATGNAGFVFGAVEAVTFTGNWCFYSDQPTSSYHAGPWTMADTTDSASTTTGSLTISGGIGLAKKLTFGGTLTAAVNSGSTINADFSDTAASRTVAVLRINTSATSHTTAPIADIVSGASTASDLMFRIRANSVNLVQISANGSTSIAGTTTITAPAGNSLIVNGVSGQYAMVIQGNASAGNSYGPQIAAGSNSSDLAMAVYDKSGITQYFSIRGDGIANFSQVLTASAGVKLGAGTTLTQYVEGTFTPVIAGSTTPGTQTYSVQVGRYTRIGNTVHFRLTVAISALDGAAAGGCRITGLPFAANSTSNNRNSAAVGLMANITQTAGKIAFTAHIDASASEIRMRETASGAGTADLPVTNLGATAQFSISGSYEV